MNLSSVPNVHAPRDNKQILLRSSSSGFAWGDLIHSHYKSSCLRWILASSHRPFEIDPKYTYLGKVNEDLHEEELKKNLHCYTKEQEVERASFGVIQRGHIDFLVVPFGTEDLVVHELKHVQSKNVYREVIKKGHFITDNLAQTVNYMLHAQTQHGLLKYTFYEKDDDGKPQAKESRYFKVSIDDFGRIFVDAKPTKFHVQDQYAHQRQAAQVLRDQTVAQRPYLGEVPFVGACHWCPLKEACAKFDKGAIESAGAFIDFSKQELEKKEKEHGGSKDGDDAQV